METLLKQLSDPSWWIGVVIVGTVIGILASYFRSAIDRVLVWVSERYSRRVAEKNNIQMELIGKAQNEFQFYIGLCFAELVLRVRFVGFIALTIACLTVSVLSAQCNGTTFDSHRILTTSLNLLGLLSWALAMHEHLTAMKVRRVLRSVQDIGAIDRL